MRGSEPSKTAEGVARLRAAHQLLDGGVVFRDPLALPILGPDAEAKLKERSGFYRSRFGTGLRIFVAARSRYADDELHRCVQNRTRQYVVLGAGLDTFAYRNPYDAVRVFEVDHPNTQEWKRQRLAACGIAIPGNVSFVPVDFEHQYLKEELCKAGFRRDETAFFSWLGVVPYLTLESFRKTLEFIAALPHGSGVAFDYLTPAFSLNLAAGVAMRAFSWWLAAAGEPLKLSLKPNEVAGLLRGLGFREIEDLGSADIQRRYLAGQPQIMPPRGLGRIAGARV